MIHPDKPEISLSSHQLAQPTAPVNKGFMTYLRVQKLRMVTPREEKERPNLLFMESTRPKASQVEIADERLKPAAGMWR